MRPNLTVLRGALLTLLTEQCKVERWTGEYVPDPPRLDKKEYVEVWSGPCLIRPEGVDLGSIGDATFTRGLWDVTLPPDVDVAIEDVLTVTVCPWDAALVDTHVELMDVPRDAWQVARLCKGKESLTYK